MPGTPFLLPRFSAWFLTGFAALPLGGLEAQTGSVLRDAISFWNRPRSQNSAKLENDFAGIRAARKRNSRLRQAKEAALQAQITLAPRQAFRTVCFHKI